MTLETRPGTTLVTFFGSTHDDINVQGALREVAGLRNHLNNSNGVHFVHMEFSSASIAFARYFREKTKSVGFEKHLLSNVIFGQLNKEREPFPSEIDKRKSELAELDLPNDLQIALDRKLLTKDQLRNYFLYRGLDQVSEDQKIDVYVEQHREKELKEITRLRGVYRGYMREAQDLFKSSQTEKALQTARMFRHFLNLYGDKRDIDIVEFWRDKLRAQIRSGKECSLFIDAGERHQGLPEKIGRKLGLKMPITYQKNLRLSLDSPLKQEYSIKDPLKSGEDIIFARVFFIGTLLPTFESFARNQGALAVFAIRYEDYLDLFANITNSLELGQVQELLVPGTDLVEFVISHPLTQQTDLFSASA